MKEKCLKKLLIIMLIVALIIFGAMAWLMLSHQPKPVKKIERENIDSLFTNVKIYTAEPTRCVKC